MQQIDFFSSDCGFEETKSDKFGIHDELDNNRKAYLIFDSQKVWTLEVLNSEKKSIEFYPIDNCIEIYKENSKNKESTCDGMLKFDSHLIFIELTESSHKSVEECISQIKSTICLFKKYHPNLFFAKKNAVVSKLTRRTSTIIHERCLDFREETGFGLSVKTVLKIK